ncbi:MAG TPA: TldD/PmbA family protein [Thermoplasmata archaeon]|nr:TldD/PmbA family protein [Thermoplasmata archaeon]
MNVASRTPRRRDAIAESVRGLSSGTSADLRWTESLWTTIRFANGRIHQPHHEWNVNLSYRFADGNRLGTSTTGDTSPAGIDEVVRSARSLARVAPKEPKFPGFPTDSAPRPRPVAFSAATARISPEEATRIAERILTAAASRAPGARIAGVVNIGTERRRVLNSSGLDRSTRTSAAQASVLVDRPDRDPPVSGWSEGAHFDAAKLAPEKIGREAAERVATTAPVSVAPGAYRVVLRDSAVASIIEFLAALGFGANGEVEGWSCLRRLRGKSVAPPAIDLVDDARSRGTLPGAIDYEGVATRRTPLLEHGVARPAVTDVVTSGRLGRPLTGHAVPPESPSGEWGPVPTHLLLAPGDASEEELIRSTRRGLLVTRFHYVRVVDPGRGLITGMTRDGTYRIENGEVVQPVRNLRFTESVLTTLKGTELVGRATRAHNTDGRGGFTSTCPAILSRSFRFTSATLF